MKKLSNLLSHKIKPVKSLLPLGNKYKSDFVQVSKSVNFEIDMSWCDLLFENLSMHLKLDLEEDKRYLALNKLHNHAGPEFFVFLIHNPKGPNPCYLVRALILHEYKLLKIIGIVAFNVEYHLNVFKKFKEQESHTFFSLLYSEKTSNFYVKELLFSPDWNFSRSKLRIFDTTLYSDEQKRARAKELALSPDWDFSSLHLDEIKFPRFKTYIDNFAYYFLQSSEHFIDDDNVLICDSSLYEDYNCVDPFGYLLKD